MATINEELITPATREPRLSTWMKFKRWILETIEESTLAQALCCLDVNEMECHRVDKLVRAGVREQMRHHMGFHGRESCVSNAIDVVYAETGYDLADGGSIRMANKGVKRTMKEWDAYFSEMGVDPLALEGARADHKHHAKIVPKFAAACALHIRTKLGALANNEANVLLVQRKYLELCRRHGVRDVDTVQHQQFVLNAVFTESVLDDVATVRRRLPKWIVWLDSVKKSESVSSTVC